VREDGEDTGETMAGRVTAGDLFAFRGFRAGGVFGILPVGEDLSCGTHDSLYFHFIWWVQGIRGNWEWDFAKKPSLFKRIRLVGAGQELV
jgi:hypothetical protein